MTFMFNIVHLLSSITCTTELLIRLINYGTRRNRYDLKIQWSVNFIILKNIVFGPLFFLNRNGG